MMNSLRMRKWIFIKYKLTTNPSFVNFDIPLFVPLGVFFLAADFVLYAQP
jgi:hypothetical protein